MAVPPSARWWLVPPALGCGPVAAAALYLGTTWLLDRACPPEDMVSGACIADWYGPLDALALALSAGAGSALAVMLAGLAVPSHRRWVALAALAAGTACAGYAWWEVGPDLRWVFASVVLAGVAGLVPAWRRGARVAGPG